MNDESLEQFEQRLTSLPICGAPSELRALVLNDVRRELRAGQWDRWLARAAAGLMVIGVSLNLSINLPESQATVGRQANLAHRRSQNALVDTATVVAEATDAATASRFARQLAAMSGRELSNDEAAVIDAAIKRASPASANGNKG